MKKIAILIEDLFNERELIYPYYRLLEEGYEVHLVGPKKDAVYTSKSGLTEKSTHASNEIRAEDYDGVVIPGGFSPDFMRRTRATVDFVREMDKLNKPVAAICHGGWMLASACNLKGKKVTSFFSIKDDMVHAGAEYVDEEVVVSGNIITSRNPNDLPVFLKTIIEKLNQ
ncbi:MAG TPA: type 1 glutamine amidotransferase domain-containing protein [Sedimentibacter sp.]|jgi:protease I|nr:type 1 glutamine amidotransferase domain-containing protein [Sedimentibacter sp.]